MESFEAVDRRNTKPPPAIETDQSGLKTSWDSDAQYALSATASSSRVAAAFAEAESFSQNAQVLPPVSPTSQSIYSSVPAATRATSSAPTSTSTQGKYAGAKSISSDQYFGVDDQEALSARGRLGRFTSSSAISSDMLQRDEVEDGSAESDGATVMNQWKGSVSNFFDDIHKRIA